MTKIIYNGKRPYKMIIRNIEHLIYNGEEINVDLKKIKASKMRHFKLKTDIEKEKIEKDILEDWVNKKDELEPVIR